MGTPILPLPLLGAQEVDFTRPTVFVMGNEKSGVSEATLALADHTAIIPMHVRRRPCRPLSACMRTCLHALQAMQHA